MQNAPAVAFPVGRSAFQAGLLGLLLSLEVLTLTAWCVSVDALRWWHSLAWGVLIVVSVWALKGCRHAPQGTLSWDGALWHLAQACDTRVVDPALVFDLQNVMLLLLKSSAPMRTQWVWLQHASHPARWLALRRAVHGLRRQAHSTAPAASVDKAATP